MLSLTLRINLVWVWERISVLVLKSSIFYFLHQTGTLFYNMKIFVLTFFFCVINFPNLLVSIPFRCLFCDYYPQIDGVSFLLLNYPTLLDHWGLPSSTAVKLSRKIFYPPVSSRVWNRALQLVSPERKVARILDADPWRIELFCVGDSDTNPESLKRIPKNKKTVLKRSWCYYPVWRWGGISWCLGISHWDL